MLDRLQPRPGARSKPKRVGRGPGSGWNKSAGRGVKGQGHRSPGREVPFHFEGGQMPIARRLPKRGFYSRNRKEYQIVNLQALAAFGDGATVDVAALASRGLIRAKGGDVKLLAEGDAPKNLTIKVHKVSAAARQKVEAAGGSVEVG